MKMNPVVHFEMPAEDKKRMSEFYSKTFGWKTEMMGPEMNEYVVVTTTESDEISGRPKPVGAINGGFYLKTDDPVSQYPSIVIAVEDIDESMKKVEDGGGKINGKIDNIPGVGLYVSIIDTEGNRVGILQPNPKMDIKSER